VIRDFGRAELGVTGPDGSFDLDVDSNPVFLVASLEHGEIGVDAWGDRFFRSILQVRPLDRMLAPAELGSDDSDGDGIPDAVIRGFEGDDLVALLNGDTKEDAYVERAWWLQCYHHALRMIRFAGATLQDFGIGPEYLPLLPLRIHPTTLDGVQSYAGPGPASDGFATVISSTTMNVRKDDDGFWVSEEVLPTALLHEVAHHVIHHVTGYGEVELTGVEEGVADALVGYSTGRREIGYLSLTRPGGAGFRLGEDDSFREPGRADVGNAFWRMRESLLLSGGASDWNEDAAAGILFQWLAWNRVRERDDLVFDLSDLLIEELLAADAILYGPEGTMRHGDSHEKAIIDAFRGARFFDAPFVRGDSNVDERVNLSDAVTTLNFLFGGETSLHVCKNAMDADSSGNVDLTDAVVTLNHLFLGGLPPRSPFPECGLHADPPGHGGNLGCFDYTCPR
jgi:hypothetical protein